MKSFNHRFIRTFLPLLVFLISFGVYVFTLNPSLSAADSTEIVTTSIILGIPHQPSYPVNTILGHLFSLLPFGPLPWRVNLMSAVFQAATVTVVYFIILKLYEEALRLSDSEGRLDPSFCLLAAAASLFLGFSLTFWQYATRAEVFPLNNFLCASASLLLLSWWMKARSGGSLRFLYLFAFASGLAFTHHQTVVMLGPAFFFLLLSGGTNFWLKREILVKLFIFFLLGVLPYLSLIPMARANPPIQWGEPGSLKGVFRALTRSDYGTFSPYAQNPIELEGQKPRETPVDQLVFYLSCLNHDFTLLGIFLAILGGFYLFQARKRIFAFLFLGFFFAGPFFFGFANWTLDSGFHQAIVKRFQMLPDLYFTLFLAFGLFFLWEKFRRLEIDLRKKKNFLTGFLTFHTHSNPLGNCTKSPFLNSSFSPVSLSVTSTSPSKM